MSLGAFCLSSVISSKTYGSPSVGAANIIKPVIVFFSSLIGFSIPLITSNTSCALSIGNISAGLKSGIFSFILYSVSPRAILLFSIFICSSYLVSNSFIFLYLLSSSSKVISFL